MSLFCEVFLPERDLKDSEFVRVLTNIAAKLTITRNQQGVIEGPSVDLRFLLPTEDDAPDFTGMRLHSFQQSERRLLIESAVPSRLLNSSHCSEYILAVMLDAVDNAEDFFMEMGIDYQPEQQHQIISTLS